MTRVCRPGGIVAVRDADYGAMTWAPDNRYLSRWQQALPADRITAPDSRLHRTLKDRGHTPDELLGMAGAWQDWAKTPEGWFAVLHGEIIGRV